MELTIEQPCPACGAPITLHEDDRLVECAYCEVPNFRVQQALPRYTLKARLPSHISADELLYIPYLRFKGCIYYCQNQTIRHKLIDTTRIGCATQALPVSLGLRPQAMRVLPVTEQLKGQYVRQSVKAQKIFTEAAKLTTLFHRGSKGSVIHRAFIGETVSRIYLPIYLYNDMLYDAVNHQKLGQDDVARELLEQTVAFDSGWEPKFISTLCPECGGDMQGSRETLVLHCANCETHWSEESGKFVRLECQVVSDKKTDDALYLPFWRIEAQVTGYNLETLADFLELTNQPVVVRQEHREHRFAFIIPAFKMNPGQFLQTAKNLTILQMTFQKMDRQGFEGKSRNYPVTLPHHEAVESLKSVLAASAVSVKKVMELLPTIDFRARRKNLIYLPFSDGGHDCIEQHTGLSISSAALRFGRKM